MDIHNRKKKIFAISGSTRSESVNLHILKAIADLYGKEVDCLIFTGIDHIPHFNPDLDYDDPPTEVVTFRKMIEEADGVLICTPEYVFSLPGSLKNAIEWTVSTTLFTGKPVALITAASSGVKAQEALNLIMTTIGAKITQQTCLLIQAPKTKVTIEGVISDAATLQNIRQLMNAFIELCSADPLCPEA